MKTFEDEKSSESIKFRLAHGDLNPRKWIPRFYWWACTLTTALSRHFQDAETISFTKLMYKAVPKETLKRQFQFLTPQLHQPLNEFEYSFLY